MLCVCMAKTVITVCLCVFIYPLFNAMMTASLGICWLVFKRCVNEVDAERERVRVHVRVCVRACMLACLCVCVCVCADWATRIFYKTTALHGTIWSTPHC